MAKNCIRKFVLVQRGLIGDAIATTPTIAKLRSTYPECWIGVFCNNYNAEIFSGNPNISHLFVYIKLAKSAPFIKRAIASCKNLFTLIKVKLSNPDFCILATGQADLHGYKSLRKIGVRNIIGYASDDGSVLPDRYLLERIGCFHEVEAICNLLGLIECGTKPGKTIVYPSISITKSSRTYDKRLAIQLDSRVMERDWGIRNIERLVKLLSINHPDTIIGLFGVGLKSIDAYQISNLKTAVQPLWEFPQMKINYVFTDGLRDYIDSLSEYNYFVGSDGGGLNLAVALGLKTVGLFTNDDVNFTRWKQWCSDELSFSIQSKTSLVSDISPDEVFCNFEKLICEIK